MEYSNIKDKMVGEECMWLSLVTRLQTADAQIHIQSCQGLIPDKQQETDWNAIHGGHVNNVVWISGSAMILRLSKIMTTTD